VLFDANHVAIDVRRAAIENVGAGDTAVGEVRFLSPNPTTGLTTTCRVADSVGADQAATMTFRRHVRHEHDRLFNFFKDQAGEVGAAGYAFTVMVEMYCGSRLAFGWFLDLDRLFDLVHHVLKHAAHDVPACLAGRVRLP
jgi:hypothetical protein